MRVSGLKPIMRFTHGITCNQNDHFVVKDMILCIGYYIVRLRFFFFKEKCLNTKRSWSFPRTQAIARKYCKVGSRLQECCTCSTHCSWSDRDNNQTTNLKSKIRQAYIFRMMCIRISMNTLVPYNKESKNSQPGAEISMPSRLE